MRESDNEILARAYAVLEQANSTLGQQQRGPVSGGEPVANWRGCTSTAAMSISQFNEYCRAGMPPLTPPIVAPVATVTKAKVDAMVCAAVAAERTNLQTSLEAVAEILGEEVAVIEKRMRADFNVELAALRAELHELRGERSTDALELPDWRHAATH